MKVKRSVLVAAFVGAFVLGPAIVAQEEPATAAADPVATSGEAKQKAPFGLYVGAAYGAATPDDLDLSNSTLSSHTTTTTLSWDDHSYAQAAIGWRLGNKNGDFRLVFNGYSEDSYQLESVGRAAQAVGVTSGQAFSENLEWWTLSIENGTLRSARTPRTWNEDTDDANGDSIVDPDEADSLPVDITVERPFTDNLENRAQHYDFLYGNNWGPPRFRGRWWAGMRYFQYDGNVPITAWLSTTTVGYGFTDGALLRVINFSQDTWGLGPTASLEAQFRFFRERLSLYAVGQAAFVVLSLDIDSGPFFTIAEDSDTGQSFPATARLDESVSKSTWQNSLEGGVRYRFDNGLELELAYNVTGYLDAVLLPTSLRIPANTQEARFGTSAIYRTQDLVYDAWRAGISFQF